MSTAAGIVALFGVAFVVIAAVGLLRMPDVYSRMQAASKAAPFGVALLALAAALETPDASIAIRAGLFCVFLCFTAPIAAHAIARAAHRSAVPLADEAVIDELAATYSDRSRDLSNAAGAATDAP